MRSGLLLTSVVALVVTALAPIAAAAQPTPVQADRDVPVTTIAARPSPVTDQASANAATAAPAVAMPAAGTMVLSVPAKASTGLVRVSQAQKTGLVATSDAKAAGAPSSVRVRVFDQAAAKNAGVAGVLMAVTRADGGTTDGPVSLAVDYSGFHDAYGGDWASRLHLVQLPACAATTPQQAACRTGKDVNSANDMKAGTVTADVAATSNAVYALEAAPAGAAGTYSATSLSPSATWQAGGQTGEFTWNYQLRTPPSLGGPSPYLNLSYSSGSVDGRTAATNNQPGWIGEGFDMWPGYVERKYEMCADDTAGGTPRTNDECWGGENATLSLDGHSTELVRDDKTGAWHPKNDDGSRVELLTGAANGDNDGEYWRVTTTDGTQYYFGRNRLPGYADGDATTSSAWTVPVFGNDAGEPCHGSTFATSWCQQAWRWNLDYVVDPHGNSLAYYYNAEQGAYGRDGDPNARTTYTEGGTLNHVDYGMRSGQEYTAKAPMQVVMGIADRCTTGSTCDSAHPGSWPDVPWDQYCAAVPCTNKYAPTFFSTKRLDTVTTQVLSGSTYRKVDTYAFHQSFPDPGDGTSRELWLAGITHTGDVGGTQSLPDVTFKGVQMPNRVDGLDGEPPMNKYRVNEVDSETGGTITVQYNKDGCSRSALPNPATNTQLCFPQWWAPPNEDIFQDWFTKYVTTEVAQFDLTGGGPAQYTDYSYLGGGAWHFDDDALTPKKHRTYSQWRGYQEVQTTQGAKGQQQSLSQDLYFRGMAGQKVTDSEGVAMTDTEALNGFVREHIDYNGVGGAVVDGTINDPWLHGPTASQAHDWGTATSYDRQVGKARIRTALSAGGWRRTETDSSFDDNGLVTQVSDLGDTSTAADDRCTTTTYALNTGEWLLKLPSRVQSVSVRCGQTPSLPADAISDTRTYYDGSDTLGAAPTKGDVSRVEQLGGFDGSTSTYFTATRSGHDQYGRITEAYDAKGNLTKTTHTPVSGAPETGTTTTNALGQVQSTTVDPAWGLPTSQTDLNGKKTALSYDPLGRLAKVWQAGQDTAKNPGLQFGYTVQTAGPTVVTSQKLMPNNTYMTTYTLYDGLGRERETQAPAPGGGRVVNDTVYDSRGLVASKNGPYYNDGSPAATLVAANDNQLPAQDVYGYDGDGRQTTSVFRSLAQEKWRTTTAYGGDHVDVTPPAGGTATTTYSDARGDTTELRQYHNGTVSGAYDSTAYAYTKAGDLHTVTDPAGNVWTYTYDVRDRKVRTDDPDRGMTTYTYDDLDQMVSQTDARGQTLTYDYDVLGRRTGEHSGPASGPLLAAWTYDTVAEGQLSSSTRYVDGQAYLDTVTGYTDGYQPTGESVTIPSREHALAGTYTFSSTYNSDGTLATTSLPATGDLAAETLNYHYNELGQPSTMSGKDTYVYGTTYSKFGEPAQRSLGARGQRVWLTDYYEEGTRRLQEAFTERESATGVQLGNITYGYDPAGNVTKAVDAPQDVSGPNSPTNAPKDATPSDTQCFQYDYLHRLTDAWTATDQCASAPSGATVGGVQPYWDSYSYDATGNRLSETTHTAAAAKTTTYSYAKAGAAHPHALQSDDDNSYGYDAMGNVVNRTVNGVKETLNWDAEGHLASVTSGASTSTYTYDADGKQLVSDTPTGSELFLPDVELHADTSGKVTANRYYTEGGATVGMRDSAGVTWLAGDRNGTPSFAITAGTLSATQRRLTPFGEARDGGSGTWPGDVGFVGGTTNSDTGITKLGARDYDPASGRFLSVDPLIDVSNPQQMNGYSYADNSPITSSDPTGTMPACRGMGGSDGGAMCSPTDNGAGQGGGNSDDYDNAYDDYFGQLPPGGWSSRKTYYTPARAPGHGIIVARFFIRNGTIMFAGNGNGRGFTNDPDADYKIAIAWDTDTGEVSFTAEPSFTLVTGWQKALPIGPTMPNGISFKEAGNGRLSVTVKGTNAFSVAGRQLGEQLGSIDDTISIEVGKHAVKVNDVGDDFPDFEVVQYQQHAHTRSLARNEGFDALPQGAGVKELNGPESDRGTWIDGRRTNFGNSPLLPQHGHTAPGQEQQAGPQYSATHNGDGQPDGPVPPGGNPLGGPAPR